MRHCCRTRGVLFTGRENFEDQRPGSLVSDHFPAGPSNHAAPDSALTSMVVDFFPLAWDACQRPGARSVTRNRC